MSIEAKKGKKNILLNLPSSEDNQELISRLVGEIINYHRENYTQLGWYLRLKKKSQTLEKLENGSLNPVHSEIGRKVINSDSNVLLILKMIRTFPQFPDSNRKNTVITEAQANFVQRYLHLFGISNGSYIISPNTNDLIDDTSYNTTLRRQLARLKH